MRHRDGDDNINLGGSDLEPVVKVVFTVTTALDGATVDLTPPHTADDTGTDPDASELEFPGALTFQTERVHINEAAWTVTFPGTDNEDYILDQDEKAEITVWLQPNDAANDLYDLGAGSGDPFLDEASHLLGTSQQFSIQLHAPNGPTMTLQRTTPRVLRGHMDLR